MFLLAMDLCTRALLPLVLQGPSASAGAVLELSAVLPTVGFALKEIDLQKAVRVGEREDKEHPGASINNVCYWARICCHRSLGIYSLLF